MDSIKCGRKTYNLVDGDTIMDNGACLQFISRKSQQGLKTVPPRVSKKEFQKFKKNEKVHYNTGHNYGDGVALWTYLF
jgi:riboflavin synthase alpha subunit